jgi:ATP-dependent DNA helicase PIF1
VNHRAPALSFASKFLNKLLGERDWSAQEINHILFEIPLTSSSRDVIMLDCRKEEDRPAYGEMDEEGIKITRSRYTRYMDRKKDALKFDAKKRQAARDKANEAQSDESSSDESSSEEEESRRDCEASVRDLLDKVSLLEWLKYYNSETFAKRPRAKPRCINYYPRYSNNPQSADYEQYCRVKILLHHPFYGMPELETLQVDSQPVGSWVEAYRRCRDNHQHEDDFLDELDEPDEPDDDEDLEEANLNQGDEGGVAEVGAAELLAGRNPRMDRTEEDPDRDLGLRPSDLVYDWATHEGLYEVFNSWLAEMRSQFPTDQIVRDVALSPDSLNPEQRKLFDKVIGHYRQELADLNPCQLLLNVDGVAGSGKTYAIMQISVMLQEIAWQHSRENPLQRAAPTGVAAYAINGSTLHSLLHLPVKTAFKELPSASLIAFQRLFKDTRYLIIDEKSMVDLATLHWIDLRFRQIFPGTDRPFGGLNILICGDFFQLPPVGSEALYRKVPSTYSKIEAVAGRILYDQFGFTIRLQQQMRQLGEDASAMAFRVALAELREGGAISTESWDTLSSRVANELSPEEIATFDTAMHIYFTKERVTQYNHRCLAELDSPVLRISAKHEGSGAAAATSDEAENLSHTLCICKGARVMLTKNLWAENGLVNGSMGTVRDVFWMEGANSTTDQPYGIMVEFDGYTGPTWSPVPDAPGQAISRWVPIFAATAKFNFKGVDCTRTMFPLRLCYAITVHKSQGMSLSRAVLNLNDSEFALGLSYVAVSRVKTLGGVMFESSFNLSRFKAPKGITPRDRAEDIQIRNGQLI